MPLLQLHREVRSAQLRDEIVWHRDPLANSGAVDHVVQPTIFDRILACMGHGYASAGRRAASRGVTSGLAGPWQPRRARTSPPRLLARATEAHRGVTSAAAAVVLHLTHRSFERHPRIAPLADQPIVLYRTRESGRSATPAFRRGLVAAGSGVSGAICGGVNAGGQAPETSALCRWHIFYGIS